jgi:hypothetical protein
MKMSHKERSICITAYSSIYAKIRYETADDNFLNLFFFNYLLEKTRLGKRSANTTNKGERILFCIEKIKPIRLRIINEAESTVLSCNLATTFKY